MERTFVAIKPDGFERHLVGEILQRFEKKGYKFIKLEKMNVSVELAKKHYAEHEGKDFFDRLIKFITRGSIIAMVLEGKNAVIEVRKMVGKTNPLDAQPGTIRGDYGLHPTENLVHASDCIESAKREIALFFPE